MGIDPPFRMGTDSGYLEQKSGRGQEPAEAVPGFAAQGRVRMYFRNVIGAVAQVASVPVIALLISVSAAQAFDASVYPNLGGQWSRAPVPGMTGEPPFDPSKPPGLGQQAPLKPEYQSRC